MDIEDYYDHMDIEDYNSVEEQDYCNRTMDRQEAHDRFGDLTIVLNDGKVLYGLNSLPEVLEALTKASQESKDAEKALNTFMAMSRKQGLRTNFLFSDRPCKFSNDSIQGIAKTIVFDNLDFDDNGRIAYDNSEISVNI